MAGECEVEKKEKGLFAHVLTWVMMVSSLPLRALRAECWAGFEIDACERKADADSPLTFMKASMHL